MRVVIIIFIFFCDFKTTNIAGSTYNYIEVILVIFELYTDYWWIHDFHSFQFWLTINPSLKIATTIQHKRKITNKKPLTCHASCKIEYTNERRIQKPTTRLISHFISQSVIRRFACLPLSFLLWSSLSLWLNTRRSMLSFLKDYYFCSAIEQNECK